MGLKDIQVWNVVETITVLILSAEIDCSDWLLLVDMVRS